MVKRNQNTIGLDLRPEAKRKPQQDRTRNVNVPRFRNVHKMHLMDIKIDRDSSRERARGQQRREGAEGWKWQTVSGCHRQIWFVRIFLYLYTRSTPKVCGELSALVCALAGPTTDALAKPIFDLHGKLSAGCIALLPLGSSASPSVFAALWRWQLARGCSNSYTERESTTLCAAPASVL